MKLLKLYRKLIGAIRVGRNQNRIKNVRLPSSFRTVTVGTSRYSYFNRVVSVLPAINFKLTKSWE